MSEEKKVIDAEVKDGKVVETEEKKSSKREHKHLKAIANAGVAVAKAVTPVAIEVAGWIAAAAGMGYSMCWGVDMYNKHKKKKLDAEYRLSTETPQADTMVGHVDE